jgi:hypothetical protein
VLFHCMTVHTDVWAKVDCEVCKRIFAKAPTTAYNKGFQPAFLNYSRFRHYKRISCFALDRAE